MFDIRPTASRLRHLTGLLALAGTLALSACGGGSGAPNNPYVAPPTQAAALVVLPTASTAYTGVPTVLTISGGTPPYRAFSSNATVLPVNQTVAGSSVVLVAGDVAGDTPVVITVQDSAGQTSPASVVVRAATLLNSVTVTPNLPECGVAAICSGQTATASVTLRAPGGGVGASRTVRFDVVSGPYGIVTGNPGQPVVSTQTVVSDAAGVAQVILRANVDAPTQPAQLRVTDVTSGQQQTSQFMIVQNTNGSTILTIVPDKATIQGAFKNECSSGARADYFIYGGTPPYRVTPSFPAAISLINSTVLASGGFFEAITNGTCVSPLTFSVLDATGRQTTATLENLPGTAVRPAAPPPPVVATLQKPATGSCNARTFSALISGGVPPYNVSSSPVTTISPQAPTTSGFVNISGLTDSTSYSFLVSDSAGSTATFSISCPVP